MYPLMGGIAPGSWPERQSMEVSYQQIDGKITDEEMALLKDLKALFLESAAKRWPMPALPLPALPASNASTWSAPRSGQGTRTSGPGQPGIPEPVRHRRGRRQPANFEAMKKLKHLYLWQAKVTDGRVS